MVEKLGARQVWASTVNGMEPIEVIISDVANDYKEGSLANSELTN